jgi:hypothetical protein
MQLQTCSSGWISDPWTNAAITQYLWIMYDLDTERVACGVQSKANLQCDARGIQALQLATQNARWVMDEASESDTM